jgi:acetyl esterase
MKKLFILSLTILIVAFVHQIFIIDSHINWQLKVFHQVHKVPSKIFGLGSTFNRARFFFLSRILFPDRLSTGGKYVNGVLIEEITVNSRWKEDPTEEKQFTIKIYIPKTETKNKKLPVMVNIHGGGFVIDYDDNKSLDLAKEGMLVIQVWYRLAPEYKYPTALEDCYSALLWLSETNNDLITKYADLERIAVIGDSAGGNLASLMPFLARERNFSGKISHQVLIYPTMVSKQTTESKEQFKYGYVLSKESMDWFLDQYIPHEHLYENPLVNPSKNTNFTAIPSTLLILASDDVLNSEGRHYSELLKSHGVPVEVSEYTSVHGFYSIGRNPDETQAFRKIIAYLKQYKFIR